MHSKCCRLTAPGTDSCCRGLHVSAVHSLNCCSPCLHLQEESRWEIFLLLFLLLQYKKKKQQPCNETLEALKECVFCWLLALTVHVAVKNNKQKKSQSWGSSDVSLVERNKALWKLVCWSESGLSCYRRRRIPVCFWFAPPPPCFPFYLHETVLGGGSNVSSASAQSEVWFTLQIPFISVIFIALREHTRPARSSGPFLSPHHLGFFFFELSSVCSFRKSLYWLKPELCSR